MKNSGFDSLIDSMAYCTVRGTTVHVGVDELPFWILRGLVEHSRKNNGYKSVCWKIGEPTTTANEHKAEEWFKQRYPGAVEIAFYPNKRSADELRQLLLDLAEDLQKNADYTTHN